MKDFILMKKIFRCFALVSFKSFFHIWWNMISNIFAIINVILMMFSYIDGWRITQQENIQYRRLCAMIKYGSFRLWVFWGFCRKHSMKFHSKKQFVFTWEDFQDLTKKCFCAIKFPVVLLWDYSWIWTISANQYCCKNAIKSVQKSFFY